MSSQKGSYQRARRAAIKAGTWNPGGGGGAKQKEATETAKMSLEDKQKIARLQQDNNDDRRSLPSFIKENMSQDQIREAVIRELSKKEYDIKDNISREGHKEIKELRIASMFLTRLSLDGRFAAPQDKKFEPLIRALNRDITLKELEDMAPQGRRIHAVDYSLHRIVEQACARYTTKELTQFITQELHETSRGSRDSKISAIALAVQHRHAPASVQNGWRDSLSSRSDRFERVVRGVKQNIDNISSRESQIQRIREKYTERSNSSQKQESAISRRERARQAEAQRQAEIQRQARREQIAAANRAYKANKNRS